MWNNEKLENLLALMVKSDNDVMKHVNEKKARYIGLWNTFFHTLAVRYFRYAPYCSCFVTNIRVMHCNHYTDCYLAFKLKSTNSYDFGVALYDKATNSFRYDTFQPICTVLLQYPTAKSLKYSTVANMLADLDVDVLEEYKKKLCKCDISDFVDVLLNTLLSGDFNTSFASIEYSIEKQLQAGIDKNMSIIRGDYCK